MRPGLPAANCLRSHGLHDPFPRPPAQEERGPATRVGSLGRRCWFFHQPADIPGNGINRQFRPGGIGG
jgi:hypothetical protein